MASGHLFTRALSSLKTNVSIVLAGGTALFGQEAQAQNALSPPPAPGITEKLHDIFNHSEVTGTGWSLPLASLNASNTTSLRAEVGYADATPGFYVRHTFADGGKADLGFMNFSQNVFPLGDTLSFNSKGDLYSNGEQSGDQLGLRYTKTLTLSPSSSLEYNGFAGWAVNGGNPTVGVNADYRHKAGEWNLLFGGGISWMGERNIATFNAIAAADRHFTFDSLPDGKLTMGLLLKEEMGQGAHSRAIAFAEYQTHLVRDDGPRWLQHLSALFGVYAGTDSHGGKAGLLYSPGRIGEHGKDFGVSFGPSVGWDSKEGGPQYNFELRTKF
jgi:hypothetical protein